MGESEKKRRGRPAKTQRPFSDTRQALIRAGLEILTETGYLAAGIDAVIQKIAVPKGSFYHCFKNKQAFGLAVLDAYGEFFAYQLDKRLLDTATPPLERMANFVDYASQGMAKYQFRRGCLVGNLLQETPLLPDDFPSKLKAILAQWEARVAQCLTEAQIRGEITADASPSVLARQFWSGWEGAVMRAKLFTADTPLRQFWAFFLGSITRRENALPLNVVEENAP